MKTTKPADQINGQTGYLETMHEENSLKASKSQQFKHDSQNDFFVISDVQFATVAILIVIGALVAGVHHG